MNLLLGFALASAVKTTVTSVVGTFKQTGRTVLIVDEKSKFAVNVDIEAKREVMLVEP